MLLLGRDGFPGPQGDRGDQGYPGMNNIIFLNINYLFFFKFYFFISL